MANGGASAPPTPPANGKGQSMQDPARTWMMVTLTVVFVALYVGALFGLIPGTAHQDQQTLSRIESVVFVIIGYYFGRLPAQATEKSLRDEVASKTQKADQAAALEEKVKNAKAALGAASPAAAKTGLAANLSKPALTTDVLNQSIIAAVHVLES